MRISRFKTPRAPILLRFLVLVPVLGWSGQALAFHSGGVGECEGCHTMHNSTEGIAAASSLPQYTTGPFLLRGADQSSVCLNCHEGAGDFRPTAYHVSTAAVSMTPGTPPVQLTPGGDFGWLRKTYAWTTSAAQLSPGERHGHNVISSDYGYLGDSTLSVAPGGTYPSASMSCTSCHDPHGRYRRMADGTFATTGQPIAESGSYANSPDPVPGASAVGAYRLLGGIGYQPKSVTGSYAFANDPPVAVAPPVYNRSEAVTQTRVAYGSGMSEWCANCHVGMTVNGVTGFMKGIAHPVGNTAKLTGGVVANYNAYVMTGKLTNTDATKGYWSLVPFEEGTSDIATLKAHARNDDKYLNGPDVNANPSCLTCHRAHASGFDSLTRYRVGNDFITVSTGGGVSVWPSPATNPAQAQGREVVETQQSYYGRPATAFAPYQRTLCNKCHVKD